MKKTDLAYIAGICDGEAYIGIKKTKAYKSQGLVNPGYHPRIQVRMVDEEAIRFLATQLGGWYYKEKRSAKRGKPLFCYQASDISAVKILTELLPFLRVKKEQAKTAIALQSVRRKKKTLRVPVIGKNRWGKDCTFMRPRTHPDTLSKMESLWAHCKSLNRVGR